MQLGTLAKLYNIKDAESFVDIPHNFYSCGPAMRDHLLERALTSYQEESLPASVFFFTEALNITMRLKYPMSFGAKNLTDESINFAFWKKEEIELDLTEPIGDEFFDLCKSIVKEGQDRKKNPPDIKVENSKKKEPPLENIISEVEKLMKKVALSDDDSNIEKPMAKSPKDKTTSCDDYSVSRIQSTKIEGKSKEWKEKNELISEVPTPLRLDADSSESRKKSTTVANKSKELVDQKKPIFETPTVTTSGKDTSGSRVKSTTIVSKSKVAEEKSKTILKPTAGPSGVNSSESRTKATKVVSKSKELGEQWKPILEEPIAGPSRVDSSESLTKATQIVSKSKELGEQKKPILEKPTVGPSDVESLKSRAKSRKVASKNIEPVEKRKPIFEAPTAGPSKEISSESETTKIEKKSKEQVEKKKPFKEALTVEPSDEDSLMSRAKSTKSSKSKEPVEKKKSIFLEASTPGSCGSDSLKTRTRSTRLATKILKPIEKKKTILEAPIEGLSLDDSFQIRSKKPTSKSKELGEIKKSIFETPTAGKSGGNSSDPRTKSKIEIFNDDSEESVEEKKPILEVPAPKPSIEEQKKERDEKRKQCFENVMNLDLSNWKVVRNFVPDIPEGFEKIVNTCKKLPSEWTVIQLNKEYNPRSAFIKPQEVLTTNGKIFLTLFCYPRSELLRHEPIMLCIDAPQNTKENMYEELSQVWENIVMKMEDNVDKKFYWNHQRHIETLLTNAHETLKQVIGPWITLFSGKSTPSSAMEEWEKSVFKLVDKVSAGLSLTQRVLVSLLCRRIDLVDDFVATANMITSDASLVRRIVKLFTEVKNIMALTEFDLNPCILIVDEHLDQFKWEMLLPEQQFTRCSSLHSLFNLYSAWKGSIRDGYVKKVMEAGSCIINPERNLNKMEKRLTQFFNFWQPKWRLLCGKPPKSDEIFKMLSDSDIFIYSGHGSGLQYISPSQLVKLNVNCPVFLFGCQSVALKSYGSRSEMTGTHHFYHLALCPAVVGMLHPVTDMDTDTMTTDIITQWIPSTSGNVWTSIDMEKWRSGSMVLKDATTKGAKPKDSNKPMQRSLLSVISKARCNTKQTLRMRTAVVCRGLPMYNPVYEKLK